jgi:hypothetical protein
MLGTDKARAIGLDPKQSAEVLKQCLDALIEAHGPEAGTLLKFVAPRVRKALGESYVKARWNGNFNAGAESGNGQDKGRESATAAGRDNRSAAEASAETVSGKTEGTPKATPVTMGSGLGTARPQLPGTRPGESGMRRIQAGVPEAAKRNFEFVP